MRWLFFPVCLFFFFKVQAQHPIADFYGEDYPKWVDSLPWGNVFNINEYSGTSMVDKFNNAQNAAVAAGGGVVYFPSGTYNFEDNIYVKNNIILMGDAPSETSGKSSNFAPPSKLIFPKYFHSLSGSGTSNSTAFKKIYLTDYDNYKNVAAVYLDINRAGLKWSGNPVTTNGRNILIFGVRNNNVADADPSVPYDFQNSWQRFSYRHTSNFSLYAKENLLVSNCRLNDNPSDNYDQPGYKYLDGSTVKSYADGSRATFSYTDHYGISLSRGGSTWGATPEQEPQRFSRNIAIRDNWVFSSTRVKIYASGYGLLVKDNYVTDYNYKEAWLDPTGKKKAMGHHTFENRGIDISGWDVTIENNFYKVTRHTIGSYQSTDGEGIMIQECCGGTTVNNYVIRNNEGNGYIGLYKIPYINNVLIENNKVTDSHLGIYVQANTNNNGGTVNNVIIRNNEVNWNITLLGDYGQQNCIIEGNTGAGAINAGCEVIVRNNSGFTENSCKPVLSTNIFPTVNIISPADSIVLSPGTSFTIDADVTDPDGNLSKVELYEHIVKVSDLNASDYRHTLLAGSPGFYHYAVKATDTNGDYIWSKVVTVVVKENDSKIAQTITVEQVPEKKISDPDFNLIVSSSSNLPVTITVVSGPATVSGHTITLTGEPGAVILNATQEGNETYYPAEPIEISFNVIDPDAVCNSSGSIVMEKWNNISGQQTSLIPVHLPADETIILSSLEYNPTTPVDHYGVRVRALLCAPASGDFTFYLSSDDYGDLYLGTNETEESKQRICYVEGWCYENQFTKYPSQIATVSLIKGQQYYLEVLMKDHEGGDHMQVEWEGPGVGRSKLSASNLLNYNTVITGNDILEELNFTVYPNPAAEFINIKSYAPGSFVLRSVAGIKLKNGRIEKGENQISISEFVKGVYFLEFISPDGIKSVEKIVIE